MTDGFDVFRDVQVGAFHRAPSHPRVVFHRGRDGPGGRQRRAAAFIAPALDRAGPRAVGELEPLRE
jgi:hypothetical protein